MAARALRRLADLHELFEALPALAAFVFVDRHAARIPSAASRTKPPCSTRRALGLDALGIGAILDRRIRSKGTTMRRFEMRVPFCLPRCAPSELPCSHPPRTRRTSAAALRRSASLGDAKIVSATPIAADASKHLPVFLRGPRDDLADAGLADRRGLSFACELERQGARDRRRRIRRQPSRRGRGGRSRARLCGDRKRPRPRERKRARSVVRDRRRWQAERRRHHRLRPPRYTPCDDDGQGNRRATLRPRAGARVLARLLDGRPPRPRGGPALSGRLRRRDRRRAGLHASHVLERDPSRAGVSR